LGKCEFTLSCAKSAKMHTRGGGGGPPGKFLKKLVNKNKIEHKMGHPLEILPKKHESPTPEGFWKILSYPVWIFKPGALGKSVIERDMPYFMSTVLN
jgi:hypothetical protein